MPKNSIILIGPMMAGKSTIGKLLSERVGMPQVDLDEIRWRYFEEINYDYESGKRMVSEEGMTGLLAYWKPYETYAVERVVADNNNCVIDFGAGYTVQDDEELFGRIEKALNPIDNVILLLPSPDINESIFILNERMAKLLREHDQPEEMIPEVLAANKHFITSPCNGRLAKHIVYTKDKTPEETCEAILQLVQ